MGQRLKPKIHLCIQALTSNQGRKENDNLSFLHLITSKSKEITNLSPKPRVPFSSPQFSNTSVVTIQVVGPIFSEVHTTWSQDKSSCSQMTQPPASLFVFSSAPSHRTLYWLHYNPAMPVGSNTLNNSSLLRSVTFLCILLS